MSQFEQENDLGQGGGETDAETTRKAWEDADARRGDQENPAAAAEKTEAENTRDDVA